MLLLLVIKWPFTEAKILRDLERATGSRVTAERYRTTFFPRPGCILENLAISRTPSVPIARAAELAIRSSWWTTLTLQKRVSRIQVSGLHLEIPSPMPPPVRFGKRAGVLIKELVADGAVVDFLSKAGAAPTRLVARELRLKDLQPDRNVGFSTLVDIPDPPGQVRSSGTIGPFSSDKKSIPAAGSFEVSNADLKKYEGLAGILTGKGNFQGTLGRLEVNGTAVASRFEVDRTGHEIELRTEYRALVDGLSGDVSFDFLTADFLTTHLSVSGSIQGALGQGKTARLKFNGDRARVQDLLWLFTKADQPGLEGPIRLRANVELPPGEEPFLRRLLLRGDCVISSARWRTPTQMKVNNLSARARGDKEQVEERSPEQVDPVRSNLSGEVLLKDGLASLSNVSFRVPGAVARGAGTYNLLTKRIQLDGAVAMQADVSEAASGFKAVLLKPLNRFFRANKKKEGATLPVSVTGYYPHPRYEVHLAK
jgi:hypothetical protein